MSSDTTHDVCDVLVAALKSAKASGDYVLLRPSTAETLLAELRERRAADLELDDYEAVNLLWLLRVARHIGLDTGDWLGQLLFKLEKRGHGSVSGPNSPPRDTKARLLSAARRILSAAGEKL